MTALTQGRALKSIEGRLFNYGVKADAVIYRGAILVVGSDGYAKPATTATGLVAVGIAREPVDATGFASGAKTVEVEEMTIGCKNSAGGDEITIADLGRTCYLVDDQTVAKTSGGGTRSVAGYVRKIESGLIYVEFSNTASADGDLVAANNLSDVASAATARANIGANLVSDSVHITTLVGTGVTRYVCPVAGTIKKIWSSLDGALTTGDATITAKIGAVAVTNGVITITQAASAAGDVDSATPTAANVVAAGDTLSFTVGGANDAVVGARVSFRIET
jgi:hypothetical protein